MLHASRSDAQAHSAVVDAALDNSGVVAVGADNCGGEFAGGVRGGWRVIDTQSGDATSCG